jgi:hypothetical protein
MADNAVGRLIWTVLPNGQITRPEGSDALRLSIMLSPRLIGSAATLGGYPLFSGGQGAPNWTTLAQTLNFTIKFSGAVAVAAHVDRSPLDPALWTALFPPSLPVSAFVFDDNRDRGINSYPVKENFTNVVEGYRPQPFPELPLEALRDARALQQASAQRLTRLVPSTEAERRTVSDHLARLRRRHRTVGARESATVPGIAPEVLHFAQMGDFYDGLSRGASRRFAAAEQVGFKQDPPTLDFHAAITGIARYPFLMRALGLVFDVDVALDAALSDIPLNGTVSVDTITSDLTEDTFSGFMPFVQPSTLYAFDRSGRAFFARSRDAASGLLSGMLLLPTPDDFTAVGVDLDGIVQRLRPELVRFHRETALAQVAGTPAPALTLPAPRSNGLELARADLARQLQAMLASQAQHENTLTSGGDPTGATIELGAEDLLRGHRVDIRGQGDTVWHPLCQRVGTYAFTNGALIRHWNDEGFISLRAFNPDLDVDAAGQQAPYWTHETLFRWQGWSLSVPRPGKTIGPDGTPMAQNDQGVGNLPLRVTFTPRQASTPAEANLLLPRLRFGRGYDCRLRIVDLAGNSLDVASAIDEQFTLPLGTYLRFDPVVAPVLAPKTAPTPAESIDRVVIHSDIDAPSVEVAERLVAPPKTSAQMAEWHGMLDRPGGLDPSAYATLIRLDGTFVDQPYGDSPPALPYLADPLARGATFNFTPDLPPQQQKPVTKIPFDGTWPDIQPFRLHLVEGDADPAWDPVSRTLTVQLSKGRTVDVDVACFVDDDVGNQGTQGLGLFDWWNAAKQNRKLAAHLEQLRQQALDSRIPLLTPARRLTLVHALQRPLIGPQFAGAALKATRAAGDTYCTFIGSVPIDGLSTDKLELMAAWDEPIDNGIDPPGRRSASARVFRRDLLASESLWDLGLDRFQVGPDGMRAAPKHEFGDTKHRRITYTVVATTRFREYFPASLTSDPANITRASDSVTINVPASKRPAAPRVLYVVPTFGWTDGSVDGSTLTRSRHAGVRVYLDRPWYSSGDGELLGVLLLHNPLPPPDRSRILNSLSRRRPRKGAPATVQAGAPDDSTIEPPDAISPTLAPFVTQWGTDPAFATIAANGAAVPLPTAFTPLPSHFLNAKVVAPEITPAEDLPVGFPTLAVAGFDVQFDPPDPDEPAAPADPGRHGHNGRWFCDIELETGGIYHPFLRLALVRFQPDGMPTPADSSLPLDLRLSRVVLSDFIQLAPTRTASVTGDPTNPTQLTVAVTGPSYTNIEEPGNAGRPAPRVVVSVQADFGDASGPLWVTQTEAALSRDTSAGTDHTAWSGVISLPIPRGTRPMRLAIREFEPLPTDDFDRSQIDSSRFVERLVYADAIQI